MSVAPESLSELLRGMLSPQPAVREEFSERVTDWMPAIAPAEARAISAVLVNLAAVERDARVGESQLHAVYEMAGAGTFDPYWTEILRGLSGLAPSEREYVSYLLEEYGGSA